MKIRKMVREDAHDVARLNKAVWQNTYKKLMPDDFLKNLSIENWGNNIERGLKENKATGYVAIVDNKVVGAILFGKSRNETLGYEYEIHALNISPSFQKRGIGKLLMDKTLKDLSFCDKIYLMVVRENTNARSFYESQNFSDTGKIETLKLSDFHLYECVYEYEFKN